MIIKIFTILKTKTHAYANPDYQKSLRDAYFSEKEIVSKAEAVGRLSGEVVAECPPGISILLPGELITEAHLPYLTDYETIEVIK